jgi:hypothetical protein
MIAPSRKPPRERLRNYPEQKKRIAIALQMFKRIINFILYTTSTGIPKIACDSNGNLQPLSYQYHPAHPDQRICYYAAPVI